MMDEHNHVYAALCRTKIEDEVPPPNLLFDCCQHSTNFDQPYAEQFLPWETGPGQDLASISLPITGDHRIHTGGGAGNAVLIPL